MRGLVVIKDNQFGASNFGVKCNGPLGVHNYNTLLISLHQIHFLISKLS
jgi:hypothetical protein